MKPHVWRESDKQKQRTGGTCGLEQSEVSTHPMLMLIFPPALCSLRCSLKDCMLWVTVGGTGRQSYKIQDGRCKTLHLWRQIVYRDMGDLESRVEKAGYLRWSMIYCTYHSKNHSFHPLLEGPITSPFLTPKRELCRFSLNLHRHFAWIWGREFEQETFSCGLNPCANAKIYILWGPKWISEICKLRRLENCQKPGKVTSSSFCYYCGIT